MTFYIPFINPLRFTGGAGNKFDTLLMVDLINKYQDQKCYFQKWQIGDTTKMQILSDWEFTFKVFEVFSNEEVEEIAPFEFATGIQGQTFKVYTIDLDFLESGQYYATIEYDGNTLISEPWEVAETHPATMVYKYRNSENAFSVIFDNDFEFTFRVEGLVANFEPKSDDVIYNDQMKNSRVLNSVPWRSFTMFVGNESGLPDWVTDRVNRIMSCDVVNIDSPTFDGYISKVEGAEWEVVRSEEQYFSGIRTEIMTVDNSLLERLKRTAEGGGTGENYTIVQKTKNYFGVSDEISMPSEFGKYRLLEKIALEKDSGSIDFILNVGTTSGGNELGSFDVFEPDAVLLINKLMIADTPVFISGFNSELPFLSVIYKNLIENPAGTGAPSSGSIPVGFTGLWSSTGGRVLSDDFELSTGLGIEGTEYYGWALCNGQNGTDLIEDVFILNYKNGTNTVGATGGESEHTLTLNEIPSHSHNYQSALGSAYKRGNTGTRYFDSGFSRATQSAGGGQPHNNMPPYKVKAYIQKIF